MSDIAVLPVMRSTYAAALSNLGKQLREKKIRGWAKVKRSTATALLQENLAFRDRAILIHERQVIGHLGWFVSYHRPSQKVAATKSPWHITIYVNDLMVNRDADLLTAILSITDYLDQHVLAMLQPLFEKLGMSCNSGTIEFALNMSTKRWAQLQMEIQKHRFWTRTAAERLGQSSNSAKYFCGRVLSETRKQTSRRSAKKKRT